MRVGVVGIGGTGSAACRHLARMGHQVVGFEQFHMGHAYGSSHGTSRAIRYAYRDPFYTMWMRESFRLWAELEQESGAKLYERTGILLLGDSQSEYLAQVAASLDECEVEYALLDASTAALRYPAMRFHPDEQVLFQPEGGFLRANHCLMENVRLAREHGAEIRFNTPVTHMKQLPDDSVLLTTPEGDEIFDRVIITAGPWMGTLLQQLNLPLVVTRQQVAYLPIASNPQQFLPSQQPVWIDTSSLYYGFPNDGESEGIKIASDIRGDTVDPNFVNPEVDRDYLEKLMEYTSVRFPDLSLNIIHSHVCLYTNAPREDFLLDTIPDAPSISFVSGCSGHGFKFTILLGWLAAQLATGGEITGDISRFKLNS